MGFASGFTGGVTLTLAVAYLATVAQQRAREQHSLLLQHQARFLDTAIDHPPPARRPTRAELAAAARANFVDSAKDKWNADVEASVRWLQQADWRRAREKLEDKIFGEPEPVEVAVTDGLRTGAVESGAVVGQGFVLGQDVLSNAGEVTRSSLNSVQAAAKEVYNGAEAAAKDVASGVQAAVVDAVRPESDVEKALRLRYEKPADKRSVTDVLKERYIPMDERDNTVLRGL